MFTLQRFVLNYVTVMQSAFPPPLITCFVIHGTCDFLAVILVNLKKVDMIFNIKFKSAKFSLKKYFLRKINFITHNAHIPFNDTTAY